MSFWAFMNSLVSNLKEMLKLEERRALLSRELDDLSSKLGRLKGSLDLSSITGASSAASAAPATRGRRGRKAKAPKVGKKGRAPRGAMKKLILDELEKAGSQGIGVQELAAKLGARNTAIHAWFNTTGKKVKEIKKVGKARYALSGGASASEPAAAAPKAPKAKRKAKTRAAAKPAKAGRKPKAAKGKAKKAKTGRSTSGRGELMKAITATLQKAGSKGMTVREISEKLNVPYKNVYIWFVTTGKKNKSIERIAPATYRMQS